MNTNRIKTDWAHRAAINIVTLCRDPFPSELTPRVEMHVRVVAAVLRRTYKRGHKNGWNAKLQQQLDMGR